MRILIEKQNVISRIICKNLPSGVPEALSESCSFWLKKAFINIASRGFMNNGKTRHMHWSGKIMLYHRGRKTFRTGLLGRVVGVLKERGHDIEFRHAPDAPKTLISPGLKISEDYKLRDYQNDAVDTIMDSFTTCISIPTGGGKTLMAAKVIALDRCITVMIVHTRDLLIQNREKLMEYLRYEDGSPVPIGMIGGGVIDIQAISVATMQTLCRALGIKFTKDEKAKDKEDKTSVKGHELRIRKYLKEVNLLAWDECHRIPSRTAYTLAEKLTGVTHIFGMSATPYRLDGKDLQMEAVVGPVVFKVTASDLIQRGLLATPIIRIETIGGEKKEKRLGSDSNVKFLGTKKKSHAEVYKTFIVENPERNALIVEHAKRLMSEGQTVIVFVSRIAHGQELAKAIGCPLVHADLKRDGMGMEERAQIFKDLGAKKVMGIVSTVGKEGIDIPALNACIYASGGRDSMQALGRVLRRAEEKDVAFVVDFMDKTHDWLKRHSRERIRRYKAEPAFQVIGG